VAAGASPGFRAADDRKLQAAQVLRAVRPEKRSSVPLTPSRVEPTFCRGHRVNRAITRTRHDGDVEPTADRYGRSFADVYDSWYRDDASAPGFDAAAVCAAIDGLTRGAADILEVGVGTGRLAIPLALAGHRVVGLDSSRDMLVRLEENIDRLGTGTGSVSAVLGDASATLPPDRVDAVLGAFNLIVNLPGRSAQAAFVAAAAQRLAPGGVVILDAYLPDDTTEHRRDLVTRSVDAESVVLIATEVDPSTATVAGAHIELRDGSVRLRPWRVCPITPATLDEMAVDAGLALAHRWADYRRTPFDPQGSWAVSVYVSAPDRRG